MAHNIIKVTDKETSKDFYLMWSTIVDEPITMGMTLDEFKEYYLGEYEGGDELTERLKRVEKKGTSCRICKSLDDKILGRDPQSIINKYCK